MTPFAGKRIRDAVEALRPYMLVLVIAALLLTLWVYLRSA